MYKLFLITVLISSCREFINTEEFNGTETNAHEAFKNIEIINERKTDNQEELKKLQDFGAAYAKEMDTWSDEYRKWFVDNFFYVRGHIKIPTEPMTPSPSKY